MSSRPVLQEFELSDSDFARLRALVREHTGVALADSKRELVYSRVARRLRALKLSSFSDYCALVETGHGDELQELTNAITTNLTAFFREKHHFDQLAAEVLPQLQQERRTGRRVRLWSAGCSSGEEPYSIAMVLREAWTRWTDWDVRLLATDIDSKVLCAASAGEYSAERLKGVSPERAERWFTPGAGKAFTAGDELKSLITFRRLNLLEAWPMKGPFDVIFCRNVVIYFDKETQRELFDRMADLQDPGGWLFIGHSENLFNVTRRYKLVGRTVYRRVS
ncbi:MAG TPA: protein-glutamate O-methyltransferase CheR [Steroidobacteraceae bacterium]|nr:protein-glutamate O-methyltransferase CheR [Steroidobacteraceae bacterium]